MKLKFYKRTVVNKTNYDFEVCDPGALYDEMVAVLGEPGVGDKQRWILNTTVDRIDLIVLDETLNTHGVANVVKLHGTKVAEAARKKAAKDKAKHESEIEKYQRKLAVQAAKADGKIPQDYPE